MFTFWCPVELALMALACKAVQWGCNLSKVLDEPSIIGCEAQEATDFSHISWLSPVLDSINLCWICAHTFCRDHMTKVWDTRSQQMALLWLQFQACLA